MEDTPGVGVTHSLRGPALVSGWQSTAPLRCCAYAAQPRATRGSRPRPSDL